MDIQHNLEIAHRIIDCFIGAGVVFLVYQAVRFCREIRNHDRP